MVEELGRTRYEPLPLQPKSPELLSPLPSIKKELDKHMEQIKEQAHWTSFLATFEGAISKGDKSQKEELLRQLSKNSPLRKKLEQHIQTISSEKSRSLTSSDFLLLQLYGHLHFDEAIAIDGKDGPQTKLLIEITALPLQADLETFSTHITNILQHHQKSPLRKILIQKSVQELREKVLSAGPEELSTRKDNVSLQNVIRKKQENQKLTQKEVVMLQVAGNIFFDETISVDGIVGGQTTDIQKALTGQGTTTARAKQWQQNYQTISTPEQKLTSITKAESLSTSPKTNLSQIKPETLITNPDVYKLVTEKEQLHIPSEEEAKRRNEGLTATWQTIPELQTIPPQQFLLTPTNEINVEAILNHLEQQHIPQQRQNEILNQLQTEMQTYVEQQKQQFFLEKNTPTLKALEQVFAYIQEYLDLTTDQQINFLQEFNFDLKQGLKINNGNLQLSGALNNEPSSQKSTTAPTPINFSYNMATGDFAINTLLQFGKAEEKSDSYHLNRTQANKVLFKLPLFTSLETKAKLANEVTFSSPTISPVDQEILAFHIEKNRAIESVFSLFDLPHYDQYTIANTPGMYHLCQLIDQSLTDAETCALFRKEMLHLYTLIAGEETFQVETAEQPLNPAEREEEKPSPQQDEKLATTSPLLSQLFNSKKREQDRQRTSNDKENGLYQFLKRATPQISQLTTTDRAEQQKIDVNEIAHYLTAMESKQPYSGFITRT
ncbi:MAG: hypothetical protein LBU27_02260 [Candidatus Peribacteria bacterium]|jgi:hypothetical protein|nr:hypothetical protein [Candidatus Peribacteria bacterium]